MNDADVSKRNDTPAADFGLHQGDTAPLSNCCTLMAVPNPNSTCWRWAGHERSLCMAGRDGEWSGRMRTSSASHDHTRLYRSGLELTCSANAAASCRYDDTFMLIPEITISVAPVPSGGHQTCGAPSQASASNEKVDFPQDGFLYRATIIPVIP